VVRRTKQAQPAALRWLIAFATALLFAGSAGASADAVLPDGVELVSGLEIAPLRPGSSVLRARFSALGRSFDLMLTPLRGTADGGAPVYRGRLRGERGRVWVTVRDGVLDGVVETAAGTVGLAPATRVGLDAARGTVAYRLATLIGGAVPPRGSSAAAAAPVGAAAANVAAAAAAALAPNASPSIGEADAASSPAPPVGGRPAGARSVALAALSINKQALAAIGQPDLLSSILNQPAENTLFYPYDVARDRSVSQSRFYIADALNTRVLGIECSGAACTPANFASASRVFGQPDFADFHQNGGLLGAVSATTMNFPHGVAVDAAGTLYVADTGNNRVLIFQNPWNDNAADIVLGQSSMSGAGAGSGLSQLRAPEGVFVDDSGAVWVADTGNNRVLKFTTLSTGASAAFAIGSGGGASATTLSGPRDVHVDGSGNLWVADTGFSRVLRYAAPLTAGKAANAAIGQSSLTGGSANAGGLNANSLAFPEKLFVDDNGRLWVGDSANNRVLEYDTPLTSATATRVYGQADRSQNPTFTSNVHDAPDGFPNAAGVWGARGLTLDANGTLWVCDRDNSRLLGFLSPLAGGAAAVTADRVLGKPNFVDAAGNQPTARRTNNPTAVAVDRRSPNRLWMADYGNNRILGYNSTADLNSDRAADKVLGQTSFTVAPTNAGINGALQNAVNAVGSNASFFFPHGVAVDSLGGVYVADGSNSRVLRFADPWAGDTLADTVFGQANFSSRNPSFPYGAANSVAGPNGVAIGANDDLWVADTLDHRVIRFANAPGASATGATANLILGQSGFLSSSSFPPYSPGCSATRMDRPMGVHAAASGRLYVADSDNHRVLVFTAPFSNGMNATAVFGQANFTSCNANRGGSASASTLNDPRGVYEDDSGNVFIADAGNNRVLVYYTPFSGGDLVADDVVGQSSLTATAANAPRPDTLIMPSDVTMDGSNSLFIADREHSRVTRYAVNAPPSVHLDPLPNPARVGEFVALSGSGFTAGSVVQIFVATSSGAVTYGPYTPDSWSSGILYVYLQPNIGLGNGYATFIVINTDQNYITSNTQSQLIYGSPSLNMPTITQINGVSLRPADPTIPVANVETVIGQSQTVTIGGDGFNNPLVNLYTANGNMGPLAPVSGWTSREFQVVVPANTPTGPGSFQVVNNPYSGNVLSNAVSVPIGARLTITGISQSGTTVTVDGTGFSTLSVINLFAQKAGGGIDNFGGFGGGGPKVPLTILSPTRFTFTVPAGSATGPAYIMVLNPPFIPYASSGAGPSGGFTMTVPP
jgi:sugar lactone lactonase YvrE